jgi:DNA-binding NarL/FixJ family response regulator
VGASAGDRIAIVLADDHAMVRGGLRRVLEGEQDFAVVAEAGDADAALAITREHQPRIALLDLNMPGTPTLDAIPSFLEAAPGTAVIVLTVQDDPIYAREALTAGASAYVLKDAAERELVEAVRAVAAGRTYLNPGLGARLATMPPREDTPTPRTGELQIGAVFAGHRIDGVAGRGGMGIVYRATDLALARPVALKLIAPGVANDRVFRERFQRECRIAAAIDHPGVVPIFHAGEEQGQLYVSMRFVEGTDLRALLGEAGRLEPDRAVGIVAQVAAALDAAHRHGLVHRDVKPANVLIAPRDDGDRVFLADFGVTKQRMAGEDLTGTGLAMGTADYMAPEQARGSDVDARTDVYGLGCVLFRTLAGVVPYQRESDVEKMWAHIHEPPPPLLDVRPELPQGLAHVVEKAMAKDPGARQQTAGQLGREAVAALR